MTGSRYQKLNASLAGAFTALMFLIVVYLDHNEYMDLKEPNILATAMLLLMFLPFFVYVVGKDITLFWRFGWRHNEIMASFIEPIFIRFLCFAGGMILVFFPGAFVLFAIIS